MKLTIKNMRCEYLINPMGVTTQTPTLSWELTADQNNVVPQAFCVRIFEKEKLIWDSGRCRSDRCRCRVSGLVFQSSAKYTWGVEVWTECGAHASSEPGYWQMGILRESDWKATMIEPAQISAHHEEVIPFPELQERMVANGGHIDFDYRNLRPAQYLRRSFLVEEGLAGATLYSTAHGVYRLMLNGAPLCTDEFSPGYTAYDKYLPYQSYDITNLLMEGENVIGAILGDGWYISRSGRVGESCQYGDRLGFLLQLELHYSDGRKEYVLSDEAFQSHTGPIIYSDLFLGEKYDARAELGDWCSVGYDTRDWLGVTFVPIDKSLLHSHVGEPVRVVSELPAQRVFTTPEGDTVVDFGQVIAGRVRMAVRGPRGTEVTLEHSEVLNENDCFFNNISAVYRDQKDIYVLRGCGTETYSPIFTFHGFRFVRVTGYPGEVRPENFCAEVISSDLTRTGEFECSDSRLNRLQSNILWSLIGNTLSIPTDCPQRERIGWTGDAQIIGPTACFNLGALPFFRRYLENMEAEQLTDGQIPIVIPFIDSYRTTDAASMPWTETLPGNCTSAGWGDAATILPWTLYEVYGDEAILEDARPMMERWVAYVRNIAENYNPAELQDASGAQKKHLQYLWNTNFHFGDWLAPSLCLDEKTGKTDIKSCVEKTYRYVPGCFYARSVELLVKTAEVLKDIEGAEKYRELLENIKTAFAAEYIDDAGRLILDTQGFYVLALHFGMVPEQWQQTAFRHLIELIEQNGDRLDTGFLSVPYLMDVLTENGRIDKAYTLLFQEKCPSWLYEVNWGATTIWESWYGIMPDGRVGTDSYNHFAFGCIGDWMYRNVAGITPIEPGYRRFSLRPGLESGLSWARGSYHSVYGKIYYFWKINGTDLFYEFEIPVGTSAMVYYPLAFIPVSGDFDGKFEGIQDGFQCYCFGSGHYQTTGTMSENGAEVFPLDHD